MEINEVSWENLEPIEPQIIWEYLGSPHTCYVPLQQFWEKRGRKKHIMTCKNIMQSYHIIYAAHGHDMPLPKSSPKLPK